MYLFALDDCAPAVIDDKHNVWDGGESLMGVFDPKTADRDARLEWHPRESHVIVTKTIPISYASGS